MLYLCALVLHDHFFLKQIFNKKAIQNLQFWWQKRMLKFLGDKSKS